MDNILKEDDKVIINVSPMVQDAMEVIKVLMTLGVKSPDRVILTALSLASWAALASTSPEAKEKLRKCFSQNFDTIYDATKDQFDYVMSNNLLNMPIQGKMH